MRRGRHYEMDMTKGPLMPQMIRFALPMVITSILQLLYNAADVIVVGRFAGADALAAVGSTGSLAGLLTNFFIGFSLGTNVVIAHANGAGDRKRMFRSVHTAISLSLIAGVLVMVLGLCLSRPMLRMMDSPENVIGLADLYLKIYFIGMPFNMLYNFGASILRAVGDTKRPLIYLSIAGAVNVVLNLILVIVFHMGVAGVAIATVASQVISAVFVMIYLLRTEGPIKVHLHSLCLDKECVKDILKVGLPAGLQSSLFAISNVTIQSAINSKGSLVMAGNAASANLEGFIYASMNTFASAALTFVSTNRGAKQYARVRKVPWVALAAAGTLGIVMGLGALAAGRPLLSLYNSDPAVIEWGMVRMAIIMPTYFLVCGMDIGASQMRGMGYSITPMIVSLSGACLLRVLWVATIYAANPTLETLYWSYPASWLLTSLAHFACYFLIARPKLLKIEKEEAAAAAQS